MASTPVCRPPSGTPSSQGLCFSISGVAIAMWSTSRWFAVCASPVIPRRRRGLDVVSRTDTVCVNAPSAFLFARAATDSLLAPVLVPSRPGIQVPAGSRLESTGQQWQLHLRHLLSTQAAGHIAGLFCIAGPVCVGGDSGSPRVLTHVQTPALLRTTVLSCATRWTCLQRHLAVPSAHTSALGVVVSRGVLQPTLNMVEKLTKEADLEAEGDHFRRLGGRRQRHCIGGSPHRAERAILARMLAWRVQWLGGASLRRRRRDLEGQNSQAGALEPTRCRPVSVGATGVTISIQLLADSSGELCGVLAQGDRPLTSQQIGRWWRRAGRYSTKRGRMRWRPIGAELVHEQGASQRRRTGCARAFLGRTSKRWPMAGAPSRAMDAPLGPDGVAYAYRANPGDVATKVLCHGCLALLAGASTPPGFNDGTFVFSPNTVEHLRRRPPRNDHVVDGPAPDRPCRRCQRLLGS